MIRGLYTSGWSMLANNKKMNVISNNLANVNTTGFKKDTVVFESFDSVLTKRINDTKNFMNTENNIGNMILGHEVGEVYTYFNQGSMQNTGRSLDMSIQNSNTAFFSISISDEQGNMKEYYTRDGSFNLDNQGRLVTTSGGLVLGIDGPITINSEKISIGSDGSIVQDGEAAGKLLMRKFANTETLRKQGDNLLETGQRSIIMQGMLEASNVQVVEEMVKLIVAQHAYEINSKAIQSSDEMLGIANNLKR